MQIKKYAKFTKIFLCASIVTDVANSEAAKGKTFPRSLSALSRGLDPFPGLERCKLTFPIEKLSLFMCVSQILSLINS